MKILIVSIDRGLLGKDQLGDVIERHKRYGEFCDKLDIIVLSKKGFQKHIISDKVNAYPTNSCCKLKYCWDGKRLAKKLYKENNYDLVITQTPFITGMIGWSLKKKFKIKLLVHFHGDFWKNKNWLKESKLNYIFLLMSKYVTPKADGIRVMSDGQKKKLVESGLDESRVRVISTPVKLDNYLSIDGIVGNKSILHIGRDDVVKDYNTLVKSFKRIRSKYPESTFYQIGADSYLKKAMLENNFDDINILGKLTSQEVIEVFNKIDVLVLSSTSESFGKVLIEASASAKPIVSTETTGAKEIIEDGRNGYLVPIGDYTLLADRVCDLLSNLDLAREIGNNGRNMALARYGDNTEKIINFWKTLIS